MPDDVVVAAPIVEVAAPAEGVNTPATPAEPAPADSPGEAKPAEAAKPAETPEQAEARKTQAKIQKSIDKATRRYYAEKARADLLERQLNESKPKEPVDESQPRPEQFDDVEKYAEAVAKHRETKAIKEYEGKQRSQAQQQNQQALVTGWEERVAKAEAEYDDFDEVVGELKPTTPWAVAIMKSENGPAVAHHLGKNLKEAQRIMALDPVDQFIAIGRLSAKLEAQPVTPKTPSGAPVPIKPLTGSNSASPKRLLNMNYDEFEKKRRAQIAARR